MPSGRYGFIWFRKTGVNPDLHFWDNPPVCPRFGVFATADIKILTRTDNGFPDRQMAGRKPDERSLKNSPTTPVVPERLHPTAEFEPGFSFSVSHRSPVLGSVLKQAQIGRIFAIGRNKTSSWRPLPALISPQTGFHQSQKKMPKKGRYGPIMGIIWGSNWAYFDKLGVIVARIFGQGNRTVLRAYFGRDRGLPSRSRPGVKGQYEEIRVLPGFYIVNKEGKERFRATNFFTTDRQYKLNLQVYLLVD